MYAKFGKCFENESLKKYNTYKIGGNTKYLIYPKDRESLIQLINKLQKEKVKYYILGNGSNVILPDEDFDGVLILLDNLCHLEIENDYLKVESGVMLPNLNKYLLNLGYVNFSWAAAIPGTIGGSTVGNAGAYGHDIMEDLISVKVLTDGEEKIILKKDIDYGYRFTNLNNYVVIEATFRLIKGNVDIIKSVMKENLEKRQLSQPSSLPSAGSVFRNPPSDSAGRLIEEAGLKGKKIGGAMVSLKHANFIVNYDNAQAFDVINLINLIKETIKREYNIDLVLEQKIVKW